MMYEMFFQQMPDAVFAIERDGTILQASDKALRLFGWKKEDLLKLKMDELLVNEVPDWNKYYSEQYEAKSSIKKTKKEFSTVAQRKNGEQFSAEITINSVDIQKTSSIFLVSVKDITKTKEIYNQLSVSNEQFKGAFEYSAIGMALVSVEGKWLKVNKSLCHTLGYTEEELMKKTFQDITHPDDLELDLEHVGEMLRGEIESYQMEKRYFHKNGSIVWVLLAVSLSKDVEGKPLHFVSQIKDITQRKEKEEELLQSINIISRQNARLMNFAHIVSHNLRSHTGNFQLLVNMLEEDEEDRNYVLRLLKESSKTLNETIEHLNEVVQIQTNPNISREDVSLQKYIDKTIDVLAGEINLHKVKVKNNVSSSVLLNYNLAYLESILLNFLSNAIKYRHKERTPEVEFNTKGEGENFLLEIIDNGVGINLKRHGEKLFGLYKTFHRNSDARGVGLFITKNQVEVMGGKIEVESELNIGTTFKIYFNQSEQG